MKFTTISALLSTVLALYSILPFYKGILNGKIKPHQFSWLVFVLTQGIITLSQFFAGGRGSVLVSLTFFIGYSGIFLLSLKLGVRDTSRWDRILLGFALCTIIIWAFTGSNTLAILLIFFIDLAATIILILKIKQDPHFEDPYPWALAAGAYVLSCLSLIGHSAGILYVRPMYGLIGNLIIVGYIFYYRHRSGKVHGSLSGETQTISQDIIKPL